MRKLKDLLHNAVFASAARYTLPSGHKRIYFYHVPKTAGTSLNQMFFLAARNARTEHRSGDVAATGCSRIVRSGRFEHWLPSSESSDGPSILDELWGAHRHRLSISGLVFQVGDKRRIEQGHYFYASSHLPAHAIALPAETFTITALRHPVERVLSYYRMLLSQRAARDYHAHNEYVLGKGFDDFLARLPREKLLAQLYHFSLAYDADEAFENITGCDYWFFIEDLVRAVSHLAGPLGLDLQPRWANRSAVRPPISAAQFAELERMMAPEIGLYERLQKHARPHIAPHAPMRAKVASRPVAVAALAPQSA